MNANSNPSNAWPAARVGSSAWVLSIVAVLIVAGCAAAGMSTLWPVLHDYWSNIYGAYSHGYLVLVLCVWLGIVYWHRSPPMRLKPLWIALLPLIALTVGLGAMDFLFLNATRLVFLPLVAMATIALVFGSEAARVLAWPSAFLFVALPQWWLINEALQSLTVVVTNVLIRLTGLPAYVEGNFIHVPAGVFQVASGCSGLNYLIAALALFGFYALMYLARWKHRAILLGAAAVMAIVSNWARVYALLVIGIATDMQHYLIRVEHLYFGWVLFMVLMSPVLLVARRLEDREMHDAAMRSESPSSAVLAPIVDVRPSVIAAALVAGLTLLIPRLFVVTDVQAAKRIEPLPVSLAGYVRLQLSTQEWSPAFVGAQEERASYVAATTQSAIEVYRAVYPHQTSEQRLIRSDNDFFGMSWRLLEAHPHDVESAQLSLTVLEYRGHLNERERLIWTWYSVAGRPASSKLEAKILELRGLTENRRDAMAIAVSAECVPDCAFARTQLERFTQESAASLQKALQAE